jgi:hypothetical protein
MRIKLSSWLVGAALCFVTSNAVLAASFESLVSDGYKVAKMTRNSAGFSGWVVSNGDTKYFCKLDAAMALTKTKVVSIITGGRMIEMDRKTFESKTTTDGMPLMADLKAGKPRPEDVGTCSKAK